MNLFVSRQGDDRWSGLMAEPNQDRTDGPLASLQMARDKIRHLRMQQTLDEPLRVLVREGKYLLDETLALTAEDQGTESSPTVFEAYPGEKVILSGGTRLVNWRPFKGHILVAECPELKSRPDKVRQLFLNGQLQIRCRWPKFVPENPLYGGFLFADGPGEPESHDSIQYKAGSFRNRWTKLDQVEVNIYQWNGCFQEFLPIKSIDTASRIIRFAKKGFDVREMPPWHMTSPFMKGDRYFIENALEELDQPGEWYADQEDGLVYFWPPHDLTGEDEVIVPRLEGLIHLLDTRHIVIRGFKLTETTGGDAWNRAGLAGYGAQFPIPGWRYCGETMLLQGADYCTIENNRFYYVGGNAIYLAKNNFRNTLSGNIIEYAGTNGICLLGTKDAHPLFNLIQNNEIHHTGFQNKYTAGIFLGISDGNFIEHNHIHHVPHHAINLASNGYGRNYVLYNRLEYACLELHDNGAINMWMDELEEDGQNVKRDAERAGHVLRNNLITDIIGCRINEDGTLKAGTLTWGIYLDDFASNCVVEDNIIARAGSGICIHGGKNNLIENNMIINTQFGLRPTNYAVQRKATEKTMQDFNRGNVFSRNIVYTVTHADEANIMSFHYLTEKTFARFDNNLYFNAAGRYAIDECPGTYYKIFVYFFDEWVRKGYDVHSVLSDPMIADADHGDFRLAADSPAYKIGFRPIDTSQFGIV